MATTHKLSPQAIARQVIADNPPYLAQLQGVDGWDPASVLESMIMLGIAAYTDASNQRPENLSEACRRLGVNLHWKPRHSIRGVGLGRQADRYFVYYGLATPLAAYATEEHAILELERIAPDAEKFGVQIWVEAVL